MGLDFLYFLFCFWINLLLLKDTNYQRWKILSQKYKKIKQVPLDELNCHKKKLSYFMSLLLLLLLSCVSHVRLCNPIDGSPPGSPIPGILQARTLEWVSISFSNAWKWKVKVKSFSHIWLFATPWTAAYQAPLSMGCSRQEYWSRLPLPSPLLCH